MATTTTTTLRFDDNDDDDGRSSLMLLDDKGDIVALTMERWIDVVLIPTSGDSSTAIFSPTFFTASYATGLSDIDLINLCIERFKDPPTSCWCCWFDPA